MGVVEEADLGAVDLQVFCKAFSVISYLRNLINILKTLIFVKALVGLEKGKREEAMKGARVCIWTFLSILACYLDGFVS